MCASQFCQLCDVGTPFQFSQLQNGDDNSTYHVGGWRGLSKIIHMRPLEQCLAHRRCSINISCYYVCQLLSFLSLLSPNFSKSMTFTSSSSHSLTTCFLAPAFYFQINLLSQISPPFQLLALICRQPPFSLGALTSLAVLLL